jgi:hypothetical protein
MQALNQPSVFHVVSHPAERYRSRFLYYAICNLSEFPANTEGRAVNGWACS